MPDTTRTFVAVAVPDALAPRIRRLQQDLATQVSKARWVDAMPFHVTLAFLGDVSHADLNNLCKAIASAAAAVAPFELTLAAPGALPDAAHPRVICAEVGGGPGLEALVRLQAEIAAAAARAGFPTERQPFHPHVTLARLETGRGRGRGPRAPVSPPPDLTALFARRRNWSAGPFRVVEAIAFASNLTSDGPVYAPIARAPLKG